MLFVAWLLVGSGGFLSYSAVVNRNPLDVLRAWLQGKTMPTGLWFPPPDMTKAGHYGGSLGGTGTGVGSVVAGQFASGMGGNPANYKYKNLGVLAYVQRAAEVFGRKYGVREIGGYGGGSVPNSDHPKRKALDFMTNSRVQGDALAQDLITNYKAYNVKYIIWWHRIWEPDTGWQPYTGTTNPHTDHVHASFN